MAILRARNLRSSQLPGAPLSGIDLDLEPGEWVGVTAASGSDRTSLLHVLATLVPPVAGTLEVDGMDAVTHVHEARRRLAFAGRPVLPAHGLRVREHLQWCQGARLGRAWAGQDIVTALELAGLAGDTVVDSLSGGMRQRLALAAAFVCQPKVALIDGVEHEHEPGIAGLLAEMRTRGMAAVICVDKDPSVRSACHRILHLQDGRLSSESFDASALLPAAPPAGYLR